MSTSLQWPSVSSVKVVEFSESQFPNHHFGRSKLDSEGLPKLAFQQCTKCGNPYHIAFDCTTSHTQENSRQLPCEPKAFSQLQAWLSPLEAHRDGFHNSKQRTRVLATKRAHRVQLGLLVGKSEEVMHSERIDRNNLCRERCQMKQEDRAEHRGKPSGGMRKVIREKAAKNRA